MSDNDNNSSNNQEQQQQQEETKQEAHQEKSKGKKSQETSRQKPSEESDAALENDSEDSLTSKLRKENKERRLENNELKTKVTELQSQVEKFSKFEKTYREGLIKSALKTEAIKHNIVDLDALKMINSEKIKDLSIEDGEVNGAGALIENLKKDKPYLFSKTESTSGNYSFSDYSADNSKVKSALEMTEEEYEAEARKYF